MFPEGFSKIIAHFSCEESVEYHRMLLMYILWIVNSSSCALGLMLYSKTCLYYQCHNNIYFRTFFSLHTWVYSWSLSARNFFIRSVGILICTKQYKNPSAWCVEHTWDWRRCPKPWSLLWKGKAEETEYCTAQLLCT